MENVRGDFQTLYQQEDPHPPGIPLETHVEPVQVNNATPSDAEVGVSACLKWAQATYYCLHLRL